MGARRKLSAVMLAACAVAGCTTLLGLDGDYVEGTTAPTAPEGGASLDDGAAPPAPRDASDDDPSAADGSLPDAADAAPLGPPSCLALAASCGPSGVDDCCRAAAVPGGTFARANRVQAPATLSPFALDVYEVTVGRFRKFVEAGAGVRSRAPAVGSGAHPKVATSGWAAAYDARLPESTAALVGQLGCTGGSYTATAGANESRPISCVSWFVAFAFCVWDGARLPTESESGFAAAGGDEQRVYPWSVPPTSTTIDGTFAVHAQAASRPVGSLSPKGDGRWGHADLSGNVWEWTLDGYIEPFVTPCADCSPAMDGAGLRARRGGGFADSPGEVNNYYRWGQSPTGAQANVGVRCARDR